MTKRQSKHEQTRITNLISGKVLASIAIVALILFGLWYVSNRMGGNAVTVQFTDIHGMGFSSDGRQLFIPAHDGLRIFEAGRWLIPDLPSNDYMGYSATNDGFYSSGHPGRDTNLINPLGLIRSSDGGKTLNTLGFAGETDFHVMGVGYQNHAIYVLNPSPNSQLSIGLYYTLDDGQTWQESRAGGISTRPFQIAVHPNESNRVALATEGGLFLSNDNGDTFTQVRQDAPITSVSFDPAGSQLFFGYQNLNAYDMETGTILMLPSPTIAADDAIAYIATNPVSDEIAFATFSKDIFLSADNGQSWRPIALQGVGNS